jgi:hypothetical protein
MSDMEHSEWQKAHLAALLELPEKLGTRIFGAETAILTRTQALQTSSDGHIEWQAIQDALNGLRGLQREKLKYPAWEQS